MHTLCWDGCYAIHPVDGASQQTIQCRTDLHLSYAAIQLTFISHLSSSFPASVGVVCPFIGRGNIMNMSAIAYQLVQSFLKKFCHFSKLFFFIVFCWSCLNCRLHRLTLPPRFPVVLQHFVHIHKFPGDRQK